MDVEDVVRLADELDAVEELGESYSVRFPAEETHATPFTLLKAEDDQVFIAGYASPYVVDSEDHRIGVQALRAALEKFMEEERYRNVMILHSNIQVGHVVEKATDSEGKEYRTHVDEEGLFAVAVLDRPDLEVGKNVIEKVLDETLGSWSIGGKALNSKYVCEDSKCFYEITKLDLYELTLCEHGKNPLATFKILKAVDLSYDALMAQGTAPVRSSGIELGESIELAEVVGSLRKPIMILREFVTLVGGLPNRGSSKGDIDLLLKKEREELMDIPFQFRIIRAMRPELWDRVGWSYGEFKGPFTNYVPLFDLWLVPSERSGEVIKMSADEDD